MEKSISSRDLGIDLDSHKEGELFKWFLACLLFGKPIQQQVARQAYVEFEKEGLTTSDAILDAGWDKLVKVLDQGHYVRYDFSTATKLLDVCKAVKEQYGSLTNLLNEATKGKQSKSRQDLSRRLQAIKWIGPKTAEIFLRDVRKAYSL